MFLSFAYEILKTLKAISNKKNGSVVNTELNLKVKRVMLMIFANR